MPDSEGLVFYASTNKTKSNVHLDRACLEKWMKDRHSQQQIIELSLERIQNMSVRFCSHCCPKELKHPTMVHRKCEICDRARPWPCEHNGGVRVLIHTYRQGRPWTVHRWRWPENVVFGGLADPEDGV